jgi:hypothetical protein
MFLTTFFICQACSKNQCHGEHRPDPNVTDSPHFSVVDLRKYGGDSFLRNLLRALLASQNFCVLSWPMERTLQKDKRQQAVAVSDDFPPLAQGGKFQQWTSLEWEQVGGRAEESARMGVQANFLDFANEVFVFLFVLVFVTGKEKEGEKSSDSRVKDTGFHCRAR